jgi:hypothetical protein
MPRVALVFEWPMSEYDALALPGGGMGGMDF